MEWEEGGVRMGAKKGRKRREVLRDIGEEPLACQTGKMKMRNGPWKDTGKIKMTNKCPLFILYFTNKTEQIKPDN